MSSADTVHHPFFARMYQRFAATAMQKGEAQFRREMLAGLTGTVIEVGAGHGLNFPLYPITVTEVLAVEPEAVLRRGAEKAAKNASVPMRVVDGVANRLPAEDAAFDAAVASLVLCSVPDQRAALAEMFRVVRPGGELRFYEHVLAQSPRFARAQRLFDPIWTRMAVGCHLDRDTAPVIRDAGFAIDQTRRFTFSVSILDRLASTQILGVARKPAGGRA
jgi:ubiquinone/menaquinone biosynthesis C-methylase UbiE